MTIWIHFLDTVYNVDGPNTPKKLHNVEGVREADINTILVSMMFGEPQIFFGVKRVVVEFEQFEAIEE